MNFFLTKILPLFIYPLGLAIILCLLGLLFSRAGKGKCPYFFIVMSIAVLWISSTSVFANLVMGSLENKYPPVALSDLPKADAVVILGGMTRGVVPATGLTDFSESVDRLFFGRMLYKAKRSPVVILSGGGAKGYVSEAESMAGMLEELGVPRRDMILEERSRDTYRNGVNILPLMKEHGINRILLVTSAYHMKRAHGVFHALGIDVIPAPGDYQVVHKKSSVIDWLPTAESLHRSTKGIKEYIGWWYYALRGWV